METYIAGGLRSSPRTDRRRSGTAPWQSESVNADDQLAKRPSFWSRFEVNSNALPPELPHDAHVA